MESNLNVIYQDLLRRFYQRDWTDNHHPALQEVKQEEQFIRFLEEIAIACWYGNGRTTTVEPMYEWSLKAHFRSIRGGSQ